MIQKEQVMKDLENILEVIHSDELTDEQKERVTQDTINYFDKYIQNDPYRLFFQ